MKAPGKFSMQFQMKGMFKFLLSRILHTKNPPLKLFKLIN
jgi:hypothetical protein